VVEKQGSKASKDSGCRQRRPAIVVFTIVKSHYYITEETTTRAVSKTKATKRNYSQYRRNALRRMRQLYPAVRLYAARREQGWGQPSKREGCAGIRLFSGRAGRHGKGHPARSRLQRSIPKIILGVEGITDPSDAQRLEQSLAQMESVRSVSVNYGSLQVSVQYNSALVSLADIRKK
jgi:hypothetical protein